MKISVLRKVFSKQFCFIRSRRQHLHINHYYLKLSGLFVYLGGLFKFLSALGGQKKMLGCGLLGEPVPRQTPRLTRTTLVFSVYGDTFQFSWYLIRLPCELFSPYVILKNRSFRPWKISQSFSYCEKLL